VYIRAQWDCKCEDWNLRRECESCLVGSRQLCMQRSRAFNEHESIHMGCKNYEVIGYGLGLDSLTIMY
jgi:hypothetical protein